MKNYNIYDLAIGIQNVMNEAAGDDIFEVSANVQSATLTIAVTTADSFAIFSDPDLLTRVNGTWSGGFYNLGNPTSINSVLRINGIVLDTYNVNKPYQTGFVDLQPLHSIYLASTRLSTYSNLGPASQRNILKKLMISSNFGEVNTYTEAWHDDKVNVSGLNLKLLDFQLRDAFGNVLDLNGAHITFSLLFVRM